MRHILPSVLFLLVVGGCGGTDSTTPLARTTSEEAVSGHGDVTNGRTAHASTRAAMATVLPVGAGTRPLFVIAGAAALASYAGLCFVRVMNEEPRSRR